MDVSGAGGSGVRKQVSQDHAERPRRQRQGRGEVSGDLDLCSAERRRPGRGTPRPMTTSLLLVPAVRPRATRRRGRVRLRRPSTDRRRSSAAWSGVFSSCATSAAKSSSASLRRASSIVVRARRSSAARRLMIGARERSADSNCRPSRPPWRTNDAGQARAGGCGSHRVRSHRQQRARARRPGPWPTTRPAQPPESRRIRPTTASMADARSSAVATARTRSCSSESRSAYSSRTGSSMTSARDDMTTQLPAGALADQR